jgi:hypothetical protein
VFWGGCVVFWCSFWVGFWLSESLRGVFTPARNGRRQITRQFLGELEVRQILPPSYRSDKGTSLEFTVCEARTLFRPHPQPLSHAVGEGCRGARRCALQRVPPLPPAGEGDTGGEGKRPRLTACMRWEKSPLPQRLLAEPLYPYQERARSGGILHAQQFVNFAHAMGITWFRDPPSFRFPPLREGNRARVEVPPASRGEPSRALVRFPLLVGGTFK